MRTTVRRVGVSIITLGLLLITSATPGAQGPNNASRAGCRALPSWEALRAALVSATAAPNGFLKNNMWGTIVDRDGVVCAVAFTGTDRTTQWLGSRVISAQKANTANAFSLPPGGSGSFPQGLALSTANLYTAVQPGGNLFGLPHSNPVSTDVAYSGSPERYGTANDPMVGGRIGGVNVFAGGVPLYNSDRTLVGGLGVSGDSSCADHNVAYRTRHTLELDYVPAGISGNASRRDTIVYDIVSQAGQMPGISPSGWGHPLCFAADVAAEATLPSNR
jgi:heme-degrading protein